jgi:hypothetical protein
MARPAAGERAGQVSAGERVKNDENNDVNAADYLLVARERA